MIKGWEYGRQPGRREAGAVKRDGKRLMLERNDGLKVTLLDGSLKGSQLLDPARSVLLDRLAGRGCEVRPFILNRLSIAPCSGCFRCWFETPGMCVMKDDGGEVTAAMIRSDLLIFLTPVTFGGYSSELKKSLDRSICLVSPFFMKIKGETHHRPRYAAYPRLLGIGILSGGAPEPREAEAIFSSLVRRNAVNLHAPGSAGGVIRASEPAEAAGEKIEKLLSEVMS
jgi:hypothetical protein